MLASAESRLVHAMPSCPQVRRLEQTINQQPHLIQLPSAMAGQYDDPFAALINLMQLWPHDSTSELHKHIKVTGSAGFSITEPQHGPVKEIWLESMIDGKQATLAKFPPKYKGGLFVIM